MLGNNIKMKQNLFISYPLYLAKIIKIVTQWTTLLFQRQECYTNDHFTYNEKYLYIFKKIIVYINNYDIFMHT